MTVSPTSELVSEPKSPSPAGARLWSCLVVMVTIGLAFLGTGHRVSARPAPADGGGPGRGALLQGDTEPFVARPMVIGHSVEGRPLEVFTFGEGPDQRMIVAGIHGGYEWNTVALADELIAWLRLNPEAIPSGVTLHILRALNPDGLARGAGYEGRANANGVDLNRNWPAHWDPEWPRGGCWDFMPITAGTAPASEPETQALLGFLRGRRLTTVISYHSAALGIFPGGRPLHLPSVQLAQALAAVSDYHYPPVETGCLYTGNLVDWTAEHGMASVDLELHTHHATDFHLNLEILSAFLRWRPELGAR